MSPAVLPDNLSWKSWHPPPRQTSVDNTRKSTIEEAFQDLSNGISLGSNFSGSKWGHVSTFDISVRK